MTDATGNLLTGEATIRVKLFAGAKQLAGAAQIDLAFASAPTVAQVRQAIGERFPELGQLVRRARLAVNCEFASDEQIVPPAADVALIPPVSGG